MMRNRVLAVAAVLIALNLLLVAALVTTGLGTWYCNDVRFPDIESRFDVLVGQCMVNTESGWVPEDRYRVVP